MKNGFLRFFLIFFFIVAQFFTQQIHELIHIIFEPGSEPQIMAQHVVAGNSTITSQEKHEHCKFLQLVANQHVQPFLILNSSEQTQTLVFQNVKTIFIHNWISYSDSNYHQARAPPVFKV